MVGMPFMLALNHYTDGRKDTADPIPGFPVWIDEEPEFFEITETDKQQALAGVSWFLDHARDGLTLTNAGYLKPVDVEALAAVLPDANRWIGKRNREDHTPPVSDFRQAMRDFGLVRKLKGQLVLTPAGRRLREHPEELWDWLAKAILFKRGTFTRDVLLLCMIHIFTGRHRDLDLMAKQLTAMGWAVGNGEAIEPSDLRGHTLMADALIDNMIPTDQSWYHYDWATCRPARTFAREALAAGRQMPKYEAKAPDKIIY